MALSKAKFKAREVGGGVVHGNAVVAGAAANANIAVAGLAANADVYSVLDYAAGANPVDRTAEVAITAAGVIQLSTTNTTGHALVVSFEQPA